MKAISKFTPGITDTINANNDIGDPLGTIILYDMNTVTK